jgi:hypothetical protein
MTDNNPAAIVERVHELEAEIRANKAKLLKLVDKWRDNSVHFRKASRETKIHSISVFWHTHEQRQNTCINDLEQLIKGEG